MMKLTISLVARNGQKLKSLKSKKMLRFLLPTKNSTNLEAQEIPSQNHFTTTHQ
jgi:hypothetical protein